MAWTAMDLTSFRSATVSHRSPQHVVSLQEDVEAAVAPNTDDESNATDATTMSSNRALSSLDTVDVNVDAFLSWIHRLAHPSAIWDRQLFDLHANTTFVMLLYDLQECRVSF
jgi:hypothetical protein